MDNIDDELKNEALGDSAPRKRFRFDASMRIKRNRDFSLVYRFRARVGNDRFTVCCRPTGPDSPARLGLSVSKKVGDARVRVRWKRLIREAFRLQIDDIPAGFDYVVIPRKQEKVPAYRVVADDVRSLLRRVARKADRVAKEAEKSANGTESNANDSR